MTSGYDIEDHAFRSGKQLENDYHCCQRKRRCGNFIDLEDACPIAEKETGRIFARDSIPMLKEKGMDVFVRVNSFDTGLTEKDIDYVVVAGLDGVMLPKTELQEDIFMLDQLLKIEEEKKGVGVK